MLDALTYVFENVGQLHEDTLENIMVIVSEISKLKSLEAVDIQTVFKVAEACIWTKNHHLVLKGLTTMSTILSDHCEITTNLGTPLFKELIELMRQKDTEICSLAQRCVNGCLASEQAHFVEIAVNEGIFEIQKQLLCSPSTQLIKETLWGISNIAADTEEQVSKFL